MIDFREAGGIFAPPHPQAAPKMPILNTVKVYVAYIIFVTVAFV